jgi:hypothetical protein
LQGWGGVLGWADARRPVGFAHSGTIGSVRTSSGMNVPGRRKRCFRLVLFDM